MFAVFCVCWLENDVCSEIKNENTIENCRIPQCDTGHKNILSKERGSKNIKHKMHTVLTSSKIRIIFSSSCFENEKVW